jgi:nucleoid-associated protein YgaU
VTVRPQTAAAGDAVLAYYRAQMLAATGRTVTFDGASGIAKVYGVADDRANRENIILAAGNVNGEAGVEDTMTVSRSGAAAQYDTVVRGDTLSKFARQFYGDANNYPAIFEANKPMLQHPDKIYPGQNLCIPAL